MKSLPFLMTCGPLLSEVLNEACRDRNRRIVCDTCGALTFVNPDHTARCFACSRVQRLDVPEEVPWRLTPAAAEALRRTGTWLRRL